MRFKKDIFISYAHIDDEALVEGEPGWITEFHRSLEIRLAQLLGYRPVIWRDKALDGNHEFSEEILIQLPEIATLVSVHSPRYVKSEWCVREVNEFYRVAEANIGANVGTRSRIFKVIKTPVDLSQHPPVIQGLLGYEFYKTDPETGKPREFSKLFGKEAQLAYWSKLDDLAHDLAALLEDIRNGTAPSGIPKKTGGPAATAGKSAGTKKCVYLAETSYDCKENRDAVVRMLSDEGYSVLPDRMLPLVADEYSDEVRSMLGQCDLSVHIIGTNFGLVPEGTNKSKIQLQNELASQVSREKKLPRLIWMAPDVRTDDERQKQFIGDLQRNEDLLAGADLLIAPLEDLEFSIRDKLTEKETGSSRNAEQDAAGQPAETMDGGPKQVYLICDQQDLEAVSSVENYLFDQGFEVILPAFEGDQTELRLDHQENLRTSDAVLIYYGAGSELWLRSKTRDLLKIAGYGRKSPLSAKAVCIAPPLNPSKERFRSHEIRSLVLTGPELTALDPFIKELRS